MQSSFFDTKTPTPATLSNWVPKCNAQLESRIRFDIAVPLTDELLAYAPVAIQRAAELIGDLESAIPGAPVSSEFDQTFEFYATPDHTTPTITFSNVKVTDLYISRPTEAEAMFLSFRVNVKAELPFGGQLAAWAIENNRRTVFFRSFDVQGTLPLNEAEPEK